MSNTIASKNLYELLGNDPELDPERATPVPPTKAVDKTITRTGKRNAPAEAPARTADIPQSAPRKTASANENVFRDRGIGSDKNRSRGSGEPGETGERARGEAGRGRGARRGRGRGFSGQPGDRHSRTGIAEHEKQAAHGWGAQDGGAEWADEKAGEAIAKADEKAEGIVAEPTEEAEVEAEDKTKSYDAYLAELAEKKLAVETKLRKANEGSSVKVPEGKPIEKTDEEVFFAGSGGKNKRERERKQKNIVELDDAKLHREAPRENFRGRGGRGGRGGDRGDRGDRGDFRGGEGRGRGDFRGGEGRGRGAPRARGEGRGRGGRGGQSGPNVTDTSAFPSLGA